ncbi:MAG TPA: hypothetical protein ENK55_11015 [Actinobacteria bacterium]|nr:hypothetical protein [Actinomycetota bacterium]
MGDTVITITDAALGQILELRAAEDFEDLHLGLRIVGTSPQGFAYETAFLRPEDVGADDHVEWHGELPVAIPPESVEDLRGAVLDLVEGGLVIRNPNVPRTPSIVGDQPPLDLEGTVEERIRRLLHERINPAIAAHGGIANLVAVEGSKALLELGGGCQGCGLAAITLRQGIEAAIVEAIPEITEVVDVTDHSLGANPYYV